MFSKEHRAGLRSRLIFKCESCHEEATIHTEKPLAPRRLKKKDSTKTVVKKRKRTDFDSVNTIRKKHKTETGTVSVNKEVVVGAINGGMTHAQVQELFSTIGINTPSQKVFTKFEKEICVELEKVLYDYLIENGKTERRMALEAGEKIHPNGAVETCVIVDGSWCTRSYGNRYRALSGCGVVIGFYSKKLLNLGIRNKYCCTCVKYRHQVNRSVPEHTCFMNWQGPSTGMESDILVDAFRIATSMHNLRYTRFVADGDSSTHSEIIARVPYGRNVEKIECANHACKCLKNRLYKKQHENAECRRFLSAAIIKKMCDFARNAIVCATTEKKSVKDLISALKAIPLHFFRGDHKFCPTRCSFSGKVLQVNPEDTPSNIFLSHVYSAFDTLTRRARLLIGNHTSNLAEYFMSIVARLIGGKNIMVSQSARYTTRVKAAGIRFTKGHSARLEIFRRTVGSTPSRQLKKLAQQRAMTTARRKKLSARKRLFTNASTKLPSKEIREPTGADKNYGSNATAPDLDCSALEIAKTDFLTRLQCTATEILSIEKATRLQRNSIDNNWIEYRKNRITASVAGAVCKRRLKTVGSLVRQLLYPRNRQTKAMEHGQMYEPVAIAAFAKKMGCIVNSAGLFIHKEYGFLGASPDGIAIFPSGEKALLEVKCPLTAKGLTLEEWIALKKNTCLEKKVNSEIKLKRTHDYYYQIQMQLECCDIDFVYFVIFLGEEELYYEKIGREREFWSNKMLPNLQKFYFEALLPEIVDGRLPRSMEIREPFI